MLKKDRHKLLLPCYRDMDPYDMPEQLAVLQSYDMSKIGFIQDLARGIAKVLDADKKPEQVKETVVVQQTAVPAANTAPLLKRAFMFLEDGEWDRADDFCEQVLNIDPECAQAYLGKLMAELRVCKQDDLKDCTQPFDSLNNYQKTMRFGDGSLRVVLMGYIDHINERNENARLESIYQDALERIKRANNEQEYKAIARLFSSIKEYRDSAGLAQRCQEKAEEAKKDAIYDAAKKLMRGNQIANYQEAIKRFGTIPDWRDSNEQIAICQQKITEIKAQKERERLAAEAAAKRNKKIAMIVTPIVCAIIVFVIILNTVIIPNNKYNEAVALMDAGNLDEAYSVFIELGDYKDAANKAGDILLQKTKDQLRNIKVGSYINFGAYEQDNNTSNGKEDIEWLVLEVKDGKALVISNDALDCKPYNTSHTHVTWETCTLREWLNNDFINAAFSAAEKAMIPTVTVSEHGNPRYIINPGNATQDQVFLLSITEVNKYFSSDRARQCKPTDYAVANGAYADSSNGNCWWWLRSPGDLQNIAAFVRNGGGINEGGYSVNCDDIAVRPALWIGLNS